MSKRALTANPRARFHPLESVPIILLWRKQPNRWWLQPQEMGMRMNSYWEGGGVVVVAGFVSLSY
jgi:hypothetical protein